MRSAFCDFFGVHLTLYYDLMCSRMDFTPEKIIFIQLQEIPTPPYCRCCSVTKRSDSGIAEALKALKMHFWDPSQWDKMCFEYHRVIFHWVKWVEILTYIRIYVVCKGLSTSLYTNWCPLQQNAWSDSYEVSDRQHNQVIDVHYHHWLYTTKALEIVF